MATPPIQFPQKVAKRFFFVVLTKDGKASYGYADAADVIDAFPHFISQMVVTDLTDVEGVLWIDADKMERFSDPHVLIHAAMTKLLAADNG